MKQEGLWKKKFDKWLAEEELWVEMADLDYGMVQYYGGRFYIPIVVERDYYQYQPVVTLLSVSLQNPEDIRNETAASEFMLNRLKSGDEHVGMAMRDGQMLLHLTDDDYDDVFAIYDLETKELQEISEKRAEKLFPDFI